MSREQVYRLVTQVPQRLSTDTLAALCDAAARQPGQDGRPHHSRPAR
ncbi:MAG TPA: helix-turn-helix transcriptional regulator [Streptosporangiaceae bacterium]|nr:helix-turn-helix transcriptional regulator [Streptosporangiaceae bacterium]